MKIRSSNNDDISDAERAFSNAAERVAERHGLNVDRVMAVYRRYLDFGRLVPPGIDIAQLDRAISVIGPSKALELFENEDLLKLADRAFLLGMVRQIPTSIRGLREHQHQRIHVVRAVPQIRAVSNPTWCMPNDNSRNALLEASNVLFPQYEVVGEYHSHSFPSLSELIKGAGGNHRNWTINPCREYFEACKGKTTASGSLSSLPYEGERNFFKRAT